MRRMVRCLMTGILASSAVSVVSAAIVDTGFETEEGFTEGTSPNGVDNWVVMPQADDVLVRAGNAAELNQYLELGQGATLDYSFTTDQSNAAGNLVWVEGYFRGQGSSATLADALENYSDNPASAIVHFSSANGIEALDGDGAGSGTAVSTGTDLGPANEDTWRKITLQLDFDGKEWGIWIDNSSAAQALGFRDDAVSGLNGFRNLAETQSDFDAFRVVRPLSGDANGDEKLDSADVVKLIDYAADPVDDVILFANANVATAGDSANTIDDADVTLLVGMLQGITM